MYLVDTSVWLDFFQGAHTEAVAQFEEILDRDVPFGLTGVIFQEVLQGAGSERDLSRLSTYLATQRFYHHREPVETYRQAAGIYFRCRRQGVTIRSTVDCLIAQIAIEHDLLLLHSDRDYIHMAKVIPELKLAKHVKA